MESSAEAPWLRIHTDSEGTTTIYASEENLANFPKFMHFVIKDKIGLDKGFFKICPVGSVQSTTLVQLCMFANDFLTGLKRPETHHEREENLGAYPVEQKFFYGSHNENLFGLLTNICSVPQYRNFLSKVSDPETFKSNSHCCQKALNVSLNELESHYWSEVSKCSQKSSGMNANHSKAKVRQLIQESSAEIKKIYPYSEINDVGEQEFLNVEGVSSRVIRRKVGQKSILYCPGIPLENENFTVCGKFSLGELGTILDLHSEKVPGLSYPYFYIGAEHASFPWHVEDQGLFSINFLHYGAPCVWFVVGPKHYKLFSDWVHHFALDPGHTSCAFCLVHKYPVVSRECLQKLGIDVHMVLQNANELIVTYPFAAHSGFKLGFNFSQASNFADPFWLEAGMATLRCHCLPNQVNMDLREIVAGVRPDLLSLYLNQDFIGLARAVASNELVRILKLFPELPEPKTDVEDMHVNTSGEADELEVVEVNAGTSDEPRLKSFRGARCALVCPMKGCSKTLEGGRARLQRMLKHIESNHPGHPELVEELHAVNPPKELKSPFLVCPVCGEKRAGGQFHLKQHIKKKHS